MRGLAATALTLAFVVMAFVTYLEVRGDPMGGEPRLLVKISPPELGKSQSSMSPAAPAQPVPVAATAAEPEAAPASAAPAAATAGTSAAAPDQIAATAKPAAPSPANDDQAGSGIVVTVPQ